LLTETTREWVSVGVGKERRGVREEEEGDDFKASTLLTFEVCQGVAREKGVLFSSSFV